MKNILVNKNIFEVIQAHKVITVNAFKLKS